MKFADFVKEFNGNEQLVTAEMDRAAQAILDVERQYKASKQACGASDPRPDIKLYGIFDRAARQSLANVGGQPLAVRAAVATHLLVVEVRLLEGMLPVIPFMLPDDVATRACGGVIDEACRDLPSDNKAAFATFVGEQTKYPASFRDKMVARFAPPQGKDL